MSLVLTEELEPGIVLVTMNRPERLNALSQGLIAELHDTFDRINGDRDVRAVILTGAGRGFCAGDERDWARLARAALPRLPDDVFAARFELAIETIIVGLRTPTRAPGADAARLPAPLAARAAILVDFVAAALEGDN